jgi:arylsulfatase A-like enzyme
VLFIVAETLRADRLGSYGHDGHLTPNLDALAQEGVLYRQMGAQAPWTKPSVATMLTSLYPSSHGAAQKETILPDNTITLPEILSFAGYHTAGFTTNVQTAPRFNFDQGYDEYAFLTADLPALTFGIGVAKRFAVYAALRRLPRVLRLPVMSVEGLAYREAGSVNRRVFSWLEKNQNSRFFLFLHYFDPHDPYYAHPYDGTRVWAAETPEPDPAEAPYCSQLYDGEIAYLDSHLGELFDTLKTMGLYEDMLIVFTSDHGEEFYEHGGWWHSDTLYEELLAVPLIIKYPGNAHAGTVDEELSRSLDLAPTVLDAIGLPGPETMQGVSLRPGAGVNRADFIFAEMENVGEVRSIRDRRHKLIIVDLEYRPLPPMALFDLQQDPGEQNNLAQDELASMRALRTELDRVTAFAEAQAVAAQSKELDAATLELLRQAGY